ncbi:DNA-binding transcriptional LysR family regulator [Weissella beninensis]|uniref:LysR family transcriptional regulator n=1 Tax=Periweissella beninensis TaxID=504936 RepID=A0ABT0VLF6_9LACO|nr:LysR substrate-binding domain-containing protein [Periweissella beninensis]MBM7543450.1 DNA-binding transcriptional LysR family regulator [Periweissella beninensis]MCM2437257.1 LysR family transcriptional regulator [Periweissella beninensis]
MYFHDLEYYQQLFLQKNFSKVAKSYNVSQPAISNAVKRLEDFFDTKLMIRGTSQKELIITASGEQLYKHAITIINELQTAKKEIHRLNTHTLTLGLAPIIENTYFAKIAHNLKRKALLTNVAIYEAGSNDLRKALKEGEIDIALIGSISHHHHDEFIVKDFATSKFSIFVSTQHPLAQKKGVYFADLKNETFVFFNPSFVHMQAARIFAQNAHFKPNVLFKSNDVNFLMNMVAEDVGITILAEVAQPNRNDVVSIPLLDSDQPEFFASVAYRRNHVLTDAQQKLLKVITEELY